MADLLLYYDICPAPEALIVTDLFPLTMAFSSELCQKPGAKIPDNIKENVLLKRICIHGVYIYHWIKHMYNRTLNKSRNYFCRTCHNCIKLLTRYEYLITKGPNDYITWPGSLTRRPTEEVRLKY